MSSKNAAVSTGRGGAGNFSECKPPLSDDLTTPTIKSSVYTTGRGGRGNMAENDPGRPEVARASQDVNAAPRHEGRPGEVYHYGRGGEGNMLRTGRDGEGSAEGAAEGKREGKGEGKDGAKDDKDGDKDGKPRSKQRSKERTGSFVLEKGREMVRSMKKEQDKKGAGEQAS